MPAMAEPPRSVSRVKEKEPEFSLAEFNKLKPLLDVKNQPWTTIPWKYSLTKKRTSWPRKPKNRSL